MSRLPLKTTAQEYVFTDASGYSFTVSATWDAETGWSAYVNMAAHGLTTPEAAIQHLVLSSRAFTQQVTDALGEDA